MAFDLSTAKPIQQAPTQSGGFDLSTATPQVSSEQFFERFGDIPDIDGIIKEKAVQVEGGRSIGETLQGAGEAALTLGTGAVGGTLGMIGGAFQGIVDEIRSGEFGSNEAANRIEKRANELMSELTYTPRTEAGQEMIGAIGEAGEALAPLAGLAAPLQQIGGLGRVAATGKGEAVSKAVNPAPAAIKSIFQYQTPAKQSIARLLQEKSPSTETLGYKLAKTPDSKQTLPAVAGSQPKPRAVKFKQEIDAAKQGFDEGVLTAVKASNTPDKKAMLKMVNIAQTGKSNAKYRAENRASDIAGQSLLGRVKAVRAINKKAGQDVEKAANELKGMEVDLTGVENRFIDSLNKIGVKVTDDLKLDFKGSDLEGEKQSIKALNNVMDRMVNTDVPDAYGLHRLKGLIDTKVSFDKSGKGLKAKTERILKDLRSSVNETLGEQFPKYKTANKTYSDTIGSLNDLQKAVGPSIDMLSPSGDKALGTSLRSLMSNIKSRGKMMDSIVELENTAAKYGKRFDDNLLTQTLFADELDRMFGAAASTSLKGQQSQAMQTGIEAAQGNAAAATKAAAKGLFGRGKNINEKNAFKAIRNLLKEGAE